MRTIARYGARHTPGSTGAIAATIRSGQAIQGPAIREFEQSFAAYHQRRHAVAASYGRMAFYYILKALELSPGSEVILPALTFWVIPEIVRVAGLRPVFADVDPRTYNLDPSGLQAVLSPNSRAVVPTHLYGQPCAMDSILGIAKEHGLRVIEDCAHAVGATYRGRKVGTFGDAAFFSFQTLKGLNTFGGGMALTDDDVLAGRIRRLAEAESWPSMGNILRKIAGGYLQRAFISRIGFSLSLFPIFYLASFFGHYDLSRFLWEKIRPLDPLPPSYRTRYSNIQAIMGLRLLPLLDGLNRQNQEHASVFNEGLKTTASIEAPHCISEASHVYYQYCIRASDPASLSRRAIRRGVDIEVMHVDICNRLKLFSEFARSCPGAESTAQTLQLPVYAGLQREDVDWILHVIREAARELPPLG